MDESVKKDRFSVRSIKGMKAQEIKQLQSESEVSGWEHGVWTEEYLGPKGRTHESEYLENEAKIETTKRIFDYLETYHPQIVDLKSDSKVIELGCNLGRNLREAHGRYGCEVFGIDINQHVVDKCNSDLGYEDNFRKLNIDDGNGLSIYGDDEFDLAITSAFLLHIPAWEGKQNLVSEILRISKRAWFFEFLRPDNVWHGYRKGGCTTGESLITYDDRIVCLGVDIMGELGLLGSIRERHRHRPMPNDHGYHEYKLYVFSKE